MAQVTMTTQRAIAAPADRVYSALVDYSGTRAEILPANFSEYEVRSGGHGAGTVVHWRLQATQKRVRECLIEVSEPGEHRLTETDQNSSMVTTYHVSPQGDDRSTVAVETTWSGAGGVGGFFEKTFAPAGLRRIYDDMLAKLDTAVTG
jgi:uncharacterized protein YndB with AHSA1/START domain